MYQSPPAITDIDSRGPISAALFGALRRPAGADLELPAFTGDPLADDDFQLALYCAYELRYDGWAGVDEEWERHPVLHGWIDALEHRYLDALESDCAPSLDGLEAGGAAERIRRLLGRSTGPSLSTFIAEEAELFHLREFAIHRSAYQRKEADPHTWALPRLRGRAKSAMVTIQADEYGNGEPGEAHADLFADTLEALGLSTAPGAYVDRLPGVTLATTNLITLFGSHRRWRGALVGHLAVFEMTSVVPMRRYSEAVRRLTGSDEAAQFYDVHVAADAVHEDLAERELIGGLVADEPHLDDDVVFGAAALQRTEERFGRRLLEAWTVGRTSLYSSGREKLRPLGKARKTDRISVRPLA